MSRTKNKPASHIQLLLIDPNPRKRSKLKPAPEGMKYCPTCKELKPITEFYKWSKSTDGLNSYCKPCFNTKKKPSTRKWQKAHPEVMLANAVKWQKANPERVNAGRREWRKANSEKEKVRHRNYHASLDPATKYERWLKRKYGITLLEYNQMLELQDEVCAICLTKNTRGKGLVVDHDHATGLVRGLLCDRCNLGIAHFGEDTDVLNRAQNYLHRHGLRSVA